MGTRADFYTRNKAGQLTYRGSIAMDGYPEGIPNYVLEAGTAGAFCHALYKWFKHDRTDATTPKQGWPWPWETSMLTDYAYVFDTRTGTVKQYKWGRIIGRGRPCRWPNMTGIQSVTFGARSGLLIF